MTRITWARHFVTGLLGRARALLHGLGPKGEHPSRIELRIVFLSGLMAGLLLAVAMDKVRC